MTATATDYATADFYTDAALVDDPHSYFDFLREQGPVTRLPGTRFMGFTAGNARARLIPASSNHPWAVSILTRGPTRTLLSSTSLMTTTADTADLDCSPNCRLASTDSRAPAGNAPSTL